MREGRRRMRRVRAEMSRALRGVENVFHFGYFKNSFSSLAAIGCLLHSRVCRGVGKEGVGAWNISNICSLNILQFTFSISLPFFLIKSIIDIYGYMEIAGGAPRNNVDWKLMSIQLLWWSVS